MTLSDHFKLPVWVLPLIIAVLVSLLGWWGSIQLRTTVEDELKTQLTATLNANVTALGIWTIIQTRLATELAEDPEVRQSANTILLAPLPTRREIRSLPEYGKFVDDLRPRLTQLGYGIAHLVNTNFMIVANSARPDMTPNTAISDAHTNKFAELFETGEPFIITPFRPEMLSQRRTARMLLGPFHTNYVPRQLNRNAQAMASRRRGDTTLMQVAAPVHDHDGHVIGALALIINPDKEFSRILSVARSGDSGETYAFDQTGLMISRSRFDGQLKHLGLLEETNGSSALNVRLFDPGVDLRKGFKAEADGDKYSRPLTRLVATAVDGEGEVDVVPWRDYRGVPVVGASCWLPQFGFGVATQIDAEEAFRPLRVLQMVFVVLVLLLLLCATGMFVFSYANLAWRERLSAAELKLKQLGQYTLEEKIGEGGMGVVYRARHALLRRETAVKLLMPNRADTAAMEHFEREVCLTCQLTHPNTIQVYDYGHTPNGIFYYAMEFLNGVNLHDLVARYGPQPEGRVVYILSQICDSLAEAHGLGLIHRDIKPANIFVCRRGGVPDCVKVLDFGLVRDYRNHGPVSPSDDNERVVEGTPLFMPPEAIKGSTPTDPRSDLYSLGALGYFLLTGQFIFQAESVSEIHEKQLTAAPLPPSQRTVNPISLEMEKLMLRCLEKDMSLRPQSAAELRALLMALPTAASWTLDARASWWDAYERDPDTTRLEHLSKTSAPVATVRIDLASRMHNTSAK